MNIALRTCTNLQNILTHPSPTKTLNSRAARSQHSVGIETEPSSSVFAVAALFVRRNYFKIFVISATVLIPCLWHRRIAAGDLASHMYNAWLAQLIERGQVTGLVLDARWNNVLFDLLVSGLGKLFSLQVTEKIAVSVCFLIFFWGAFALVSAASERAPWFLVPLFAMV